MVDPKDPNHDDLLQEAFASVGATPVPDGPPEELVAQVSAALHRAEEAANQPSTMNFKERILAMKLTTKLTTRIAIAATVLIAVGGLLAWLAPGGGTVFAFEKVAEAFANIRTATCKFTSERNEGKTAVEGQVMFLAPSRQRQEGPVPGGQMIMIYDGAQGKCLTLVPGEKVAFFTEIENMPADKQTNTFEQMRKLVSDARSGAVDEIEELGRQTIDGRQAVGFRIIEDNTQQTVWADPETGLPIRVEFVRRAGPKHASVWSDFRINVELDESLFSMDVPEGYTVGNLSLDVSEEPTAEDLVKALRLVAESNDGKFPASLRNSDDLMNALLTPIYEEQGETAAKKAIVQLMPKIARAVNFLGTQLTPESDWHYAGKGVTIDTPHRPIYWYRPEPTAMYTVIYADLSVKQVPAADLPKVPGSSEEAEESATP